MRHSKYERLLVLSLNGGLQDNEEEDLARHVQECARCQRERAALEKLHSLSDLLREDNAVDETLLAEARQEFRVLLHREARLHRRAHSQERSPWTRPALGYGLGFALTFAVGLGIGFLRFGWHPEPERLGPLPQVTPARESTPSAGRTRITNVQFLDRGTASGNVEFTFDAVTPVHMRGTIDDPAVQKVLVSAVLNDDNPGVRLSAVNAFASGPPLKADSAVKAAMIKALAFDPNIGVRKQAIVALKSMPMDGDIKRALLGTLRSDSNPGLRIAAINALDPVLNQPGAIDQNVREVLQQRALTDHNDYIRLKAKAVLLEKQ